MLKKTISLCVAVIMLLMVGTFNAQAAEKVKLSLFAASVPEGMPVGQLIKFLGEKIPEYSGGTIETAVFYDTQLGDASSLMQALQQGTVDIGSSGNAYFSGIVPQIQVFELPFMFNSYEQARAGVDGPVGKKLLAMFDKKGIKGLAFAEIGFRQYTNSVRAAKTPDDIKGVKMRTLPAPVQVKTWELLGALPTPIDAAELYAALQQGIVRAQDNSLFDISLRKFNEVQKYMSMTSHVYTPAFLGMSAKTWKKLDDKQKEAVQRAVVDGIKFSRTYLDNVEKQMLADLQKNGMEIEFNPDREKFKEVAIGSYKLFTDKFGDELVKELQAGVKK